MRKAKDKKKGSSKNKGISDRPSSAMPANQSSGQPQSASSAINPITNISQVTNGVLNSNNTNQIRNRIQQHQSKVR